MACIKRRCAKFVTVKFICPNSMPACGIWASKTAVFACVGYVSRKIPQKMGEEYPGIFDGWCLPFATSFPT